MANPADLPGEEDEEEGDEMEEAAVVGSFKKETPSLRGVGEEECSY